MNHIPDEKQIEELLEHAAPTTTGRLERRLASAPWSTRMVNRRRFLHATIFAVIMVTAVFAATPQAYALAQDILQFFTRTQSDTFYQPTSDLTFEDTTPFYAQCGISIAPTCSVDQIRSMVGFEIKEFGILPEGVRFIGATGGPDFVELKYGYPAQIDGNLSVIIEAVGKPSPIGTGIIAKSANVQQVQIGNLLGEYYKGILFQDEQGNVTWQPDGPTLTLRWEDSGSTYTLVYYSPGIPLTKEDLIAVAESMTTEPVAK